MKQLLKLSAIAALGFTASASLAADLPSRSVMPVMAPVMAPAFNWTGARIGVQGGWAGGGDDRFGLFSNSVGNFRSLGSLAVRGGFIGGHVGYDYQFAGTPFVLGYIADVNLNFMDRSASGVVGLTNFSGKSESKWDISLRARLGYSLGRTLLYGTGGVTFNQQEYSVTTVTPAVTSIKNDSNYTGYTVGAGIEHAVTDNLIIGAEYRYTGFSDKKLRGTVVGNPLGFTQTTSTPNWHRFAITAAYKF